MKRVPPPGVYGEQWATIPSMVCDVILCWAVPCCTPSCIPRHAVPCYTSCERSLPAYSIRINRGTQEPSRSPRAFHFPDSRSMHIHHPPSSILHHTPNMAGFAVLAGWRPRSLDGEQAEYQRQTDTRRTSMKYGSPPVHARISQ